MCCILTELFQCFLYLRETETKVLSGSKDCAAAGAAAIEERSIGQFNSQMIQLGKYSNQQEDFESLYKTAWTTQTAAPPSAACTRQEASDHQCIQFQHQASPRHLFTLRRRCSPHHRGLIRLRISDRKFVNHTTEMIL